MCIKASNTNMPAISDAKLQFCVECSAKPAVHTFHELDDHSVVEAARQLCDECIPTFPCPKCKIDVAATTSGDLKKKTRLCSTCRHKKTRLAPGQKALFCTSCERTGVDSTYVRRNGFLCEVCNAARLQREIDQAPSSSIRAKQLATAALIESKSSLPSSEEEEDASMEPAPNPTCGDCKKCVGQVEVVDMTTKHVKGKPPSKWLCGQCMKNYLCSTPECPNWIKAFGPTDEGYDLRLCGSCTRATDKKNSPKRKRSSTKKTSVVAQKSKAAKKPKGKGKKT